MQSMLALRLQIAVIDALAEYGPDAKDALPELKAYLQTPAPANGYQNDPQRNVQAAIKAALPRITGSPVKTKKSSRQ